MLTELGHAVLGVIWTEQPCTAYTVRVVFQKSPSAHRSGSAGAIYPLIRRLERRRLVRSVARRGDQRKTRLYRLTTAGQRAFETWLRPPLPPASELINVDPLRVRVRFLGALPSAQRRAAISEARQKLRAFLTQVGAEVRKARARGDTAQYLVSSGVQTSVRAQLTWLAKVEQTL
jgi:DNA-binding PadR family transcriptional regulator